MDLNNSKSKIPGKETGYTRKILFSHVFYYFVNFQISSFFLLFFL
jgi:hypothetical protein